MKRRNFLKITLPLALEGKAFAAPTVEPDLIFGAIADPHAAAGQAGQRMIAFNHYPAFPAVPANLRDAADIVFLIWNHGMCVTPDRRGAAETSPTAASGVARHRATPWQSTGAPFWGRVPEK